MTSTVNKTPLLDGPRRSLALALMTVDGVVTWLEARDADEIVEQVVAANPDRYPTGVGANCGICQPDDRATIAAVALTIASGPGSSRNVLAAAIVIAAAAFFVPLVLHSDTIDIVTTAHGG
jgi:bacterioferritin-associated ferredoxin